MKSIIWAAMAALLAIDCRVSDEPSLISDRAAQDSSGPVELWLAAGDEVRVALLRLRFAGVPADSRCPNDVLCPWEGDAAVEVHCALGMGPSYPDTLHTTQDPKRVEFGGYAITLLELVPYPQTTEPIPLDEYAARLRIERLAN